LIFVLIFVLISISTHFLSCVEAPNLLEEEAADEEEALEASGALEDCSTSHTRTE